LSVHAIAVHRAASKPARFDSSRLSPQDPKTDLTRQFTMIRPTRSALYMPGSNARAIEKAKTLATDAVILDLEDAVAPDAKAEARERVCGAVAAGGFGPRQVVIRINALDTPWGMADLDAAAKAKPDAVLLPKPNSAGDIDRASAALRQADAPETTKLWAMIETPLAVLDAKSIAGAARYAGSRLTCLVLGTNDLIKETRAELDAQRTAALYWLSASVIAARAYGLTVLDGVYNDFKNADGLARECAHGRMLGFDGKTLIHPDQIGTANSTFAPSAVEIAAARKIIAAFDLPENKGKGVITLDGRMIELLHADMARRTVAIADAIAARG
jgi:citrate lyase subunit beta / citryl-CoA lyase